jgi:hypothetical protein
MIRFKTRQDSRRGESDRRKGHWASVTSKLASMMQLD